MQTTTLRRLAFLLLATFGAAACDSDSSPAPSPPPPPPPPVQAEFEVTVVNTTNAQPLSPVAVIAHTAEYSVFSIGDPATAGLETLAEGGDNALLLSEAEGSAAVITTASGAAPIGPAGSESILLTVDNVDRLGMRISVATMLVNTNDAFTALSGFPIQEMAVGDVMTFDAVAYDAGTEADSEAAASIPGPAGGGEGFNAARDDEGDRISMHSGVVSGDDGLATSDLTGQHRFDNPVARIRIERIS